VADLLVVDYEPLPSVTDTAEAAQPGAPPVWDECPDNFSNLFEGGDRAATEAAFARAARIVRRRYAISRVYAHYMETRGAIGTYDPGVECYTLYAGCQYPHRVRNALAAQICKVPESKTLMEEVAYDPESGQLLTGSLMDYSLPHADSLCGMHVLSHPVPTGLNPLGAKGAGEAGTVGALPAVMNAVLNALAPLGVRDLDMPATSEKVWRAIRSAGTTPP
jgi:CO/xanthine dehydrogenase Mo-binding subunit